MSRWYSARFSSRPLSLKRAEPKAPAGVWRSARIVAGLSRARSIRSSVRAPTIPSRAAKMRPILREWRRAVSITPQAEALITAETPPDWAYSALRGLIAGFIGGTFDCVRPRAYLRSNPHSSAARRWFDLRGPDRYCFADEN